MYQTGPKSFTMHMWWLYLKNIFYIIYYKVVLVMGLIKICHLNHIPKIKKLPPKLWKIFLLKSENFGVIDIIPFG